MSFSFPDFEGTDIVVEMTGAPAGTRDDGVRAQVLRGRGEFGFLLVPPPQSLTRMQLPSSDIRSAMT